MSTQVLVNHTCIVHIGDNMGVSFPKMTESEAGLFSSNNKTHQPLASFGSQATLHFNSNQNQTKANIIIRKVLKRLLHLYPLESRLRLATNKIIQRNHKCN